MRVLTPEEEEKKLAESRAKSKSAKADQSVMRQNNNNASAVKKQNPSVNQKLQLPTSNKGKRLHLTQKRLENGKVFEYEAIREKDDSRFG